MLGSLLWTIVVVLFVLWLLGFLFHVAGGLIHIPPLLYLKRIFYPCACTSGVAIAPLFCMSSSCSGLMPSCCSR